MSVEQKQIKFPNQEQSPILKEARKEKFRILRPCEYELIRKTARKIQQQTRLDALLLTGARYVEVQRLHDHKEWFEGRFVKLPSEASRKVERTQRERWVRLSNKGVAVLPYFFTVENLPTARAWSYNLKGWAMKARLDPIGLSAKTMRKTMESWLAFYYPEMLHAIILSQGHTWTTAFGHYLNLPFTEGDRREMKEWLDGWI